MNVKNECDCGHEASTWTHVKKYVHGSVVENSTMCPVCYYFSSFCNVEQVKKGNYEAYMKMSANAEVRIRETERKK